MKRYLIICVIPFLLLTACGKVYDYGDVSVSPYEYSTDISDDTAQEKSSIDNSSDDSKKNSKSKKKSKKKASEKLTIMEENWGVATMPLAQMAKIMMVDNWDKHVKKKQGDALKEIAPVETKMYRHVKYVEFYAQTYRKSQLATLLKESDIKELPEEHQRAIGCLIRHGWVKSSYLSSKGVSHNIISYLVEMDRSL